MTNSPEFVSFVLEQLGDLPALDSRSMFGGHGLYAGKVFFGVVYDDRLYLKTDDSTRPWYEERGMDYFRPNPRQNITSYYEVPPDSLEDSDELLRLAEQAIAAQAGN